MTVFLVFVAVVFGVGGILETLIVRIELTDDAMLVTNLRGRRSIGIDDIERLEESKGTPPAVRLKNGEWVQLPAVGNHLGNSVRLWLRHAKLRTDQGR
jgi:hypothetical protein